MEYGVIIGGVTKKRLRSGGINITSFFFFFNFFFLIKSKQTIWAHSRDLQCPVQHFDAYVFQSSGGCYLRDPLFVV